VGSWIRGGWANPGESGGGGVSYLRYGPAPPLAVEWLRHLGVAHLRVYRSLTFTPAVSAAYCPTTKRPPSQKTPHFFCFGGDDFFEIGVSFPFDHENP